MIRRGLRIDDDSDTQVKEQRVTLDANRKRGAFEKDMDNFLFGGPPVRRKQPSKDQPPKNPQPPTILKPYSYTTATKPSPQVQKTESSVIINQSTIQTKTITTTIQKSFESSSVSGQMNKSRTSQVVSPAAKTSNQSLKGSNVSGKGQSSITNNNQQIKSELEPKVLGERQMSEFFRQVQSTRPNYIRKLKHVTDVDSFAQQNKKQHKFIDVVRPIECSKNYLSKYQQFSSPKDRQFPPNKTSLGAQLQDFQVQWKKFQETVSNPTLGKYIDPNDIKKGRFSSSKFISTLSVLAQKEENIKRLIQDQIFNNIQGIYFVRLFLNSVWRYIAVDNYMPICENINANATSYNDAESDLWVSLVQKAYAKAFNGYDVFSRPQPREYYLRDLTGAPTSNYRIDNPEIINIVKKAIENKKVVAAVMKSNVSDLGVNPNCTLAVLGVNKKGGFTIRYSWPLIQQKASIPISREGVFELSDAQLHEYLSYITISNVNRSYFTTTVQTRHQKQFYVAYKVTIKQQTHGYFTMSQLDERMFPRQAYIYEPGRILIHRKMQGNKYEFVNGGFSHMSRNLDVEVTLTPGEYYVFAFINWNRHVYDFCLTFYGSREIDFVRVSTMKNHNMISLGLQNENLQAGKRSALGHVHQYISYHQQTNLVLITVINTSSKPYLYVNDLNKINFQSLFLMNLTNNQHDVLENMTKDQLENYKLSPTENRKWEIELAPQEVFTWIISTNENYDSNNYKNWGFR